jgi:hypothetical protein
MTVLFPLTTFLSSVPVAPYSEYELNIHQVCVLEWNEFRLYIYDLRSLRSSIYPRWIKIEKRSVFLCTHLQITKNDIGWYVTQTVSSFKMLVSNPEERNYLENLNVDGCLLILIVKK